MTNQTISRRSILGRTYRPRNPVYATAILAVLPLLARTLAHAARVDIPRNTISTAHVASGRALSINDKARMHLTGGSGNTLIEEGKATGTLPGKAKVSLTIINTTTAKSSFVVHPNGGSIPGLGIVRLHPGKSGAYESFSGTITVSHGTGSYAHTSGSGKLYGVLDRSNDNAEVQVIGTLHYY
jgi:hypothetical protein